MEMHFFKKHHNNILFFLSKINPFNFFHLSLSIQIVFSIIIGVSLGVVLRYFPDLFSCIGLKATSFQHLGNLFIKMVKMIAMPLIFACIMQSVISLCRKASTGKTTMLTIVVFVFMTLICISSGLLFALFIVSWIISNLSFDDLELQNFCLILSQVIFLFPLLKVIFYKLSFLQLCFPLELPKLIKKAIFITA